MADQRFPTRRSHRFSSFTRWRRFSFMRELEEGSVETSKASNKRTTKAIFAQLGKRVLYKNWIFLACMCAFKRSFSGRKRALLWRLLCIFSMIIIFMWWSEFDFVFKKNKRSIILILSGFCCVHIFRKSRSSCYVWFIN